MAFFSSPLKPRRSLSSQVSALNFPLPFSDRCTPLEDGCLVLPAPFLSSSSCFSSPSPGRRKDGLLFGTTEKWETRFFFSSSWITPVFLGRGHSLPFLRSKGCLLEVGRLRSYRLGVGCPFSPPVVNFFSLRPGKHDCS